ncbi:MAG: FAD-dependent oxidoreductase [Micrococcales bacterium]|nr:FAD-dependent oxidoreductase [Micrococcales bacterium]
MSDPPVEAMFPHLFTPLRVGAVTLKNRIFSSGHDTVMAHSGAVTDRLIAYHEARARGGVGLIVVQVVGVHESARYTSHVLMATDDSAIPGFRKLADRVHAHDTHVFAQLFHPGREIMESQDGSAPVALAPSAVPNERFRVMPRAMPLPLVHEVVEGYVATARRLQSAGLDGVEVVASHGYLPAQFLNPRTNVRDDEYGGGDERRLRFLREVVDGIRAAVGPAFVVGIRISGDEMSEEGLTTDEVVRACVTLAARCRMDYVSICAGTSATMAGSDHIAPSMAWPAAYTAPLAAKVKAKLDLPVLVAGRINQPQEAEQVIAGGSADACAMTRALICDPDLPVKAESGRAEEIRACIGCNQACIGHFHAGYPISCIQRPETGRELRYGTRTRAAAARRVMVVGGGPAGLKAAAVAAERGHEVTLHEASRRVGGQVLLAEQLPGRAEFGGAVTNLVGEVERAGARVITGSRVTRDVVDREAPDAVIVATGARPRDMPLEITDAMPVLDAWQVLDGASLPRGPVVVADWRADWIGLGVALLLAQRGRRVSLAINAYQPGEMLQRYVRDDMLSAAYRSKVQMIPLVRPYGADEDSVYLQHVLTGEPVIVDGVSALVLAQGHEPVDDLVTALAGYHPEVHLVGDCLSPRTVEEAVLEGLEVASLV